MTVTFAADHCSRCSRPSDDLLDRAHGERICGQCRTDEEARYRAAMAAYAEAGFGEMPPLEQRRRDGDR